MTKFMPTNNSCTSRKGPILELIGAGPTALLRGRIFLLHGPYLLPIVKKAYVWQKFVKPNFESMPMNTANNIYVLLSNRPSTMVTNTNRGLFGIACVANSANLHGNESTELYVRLLDDPVYRLKRKSEGTLLPIRTSQELKVPFKGNVKVDSVSDMLHPSRHHSLERK